MLDPYFRLMSIIYLHLLAASVYPAQRLSHSHICQAFHHLLGYVFQSIVGVLTTEPQFGLRKVNID
jgi:hypothetical protein